jgi:hypothetical protein
VTITNPQGYFDAHVAFPSSGTVRVAWTPPSCGSSPSPTPCLAAIYFSRSQSITIR